MVQYYLMITADFENIATLQPQGGVDDPEFSYLFKLKCGNCNEQTDKEVCVSLGETVPLRVGKGNTNLVLKCKFCAREGTITMIPGRGKPLSDSFTEAGKSCPLMFFDCRNFEPVEFVFDAGWKAQSPSGTVFENVDLSPGEFAEYDEKGECPVMISNLRATFETA